MQAAFDGRALFVTAFFTQNGKNIEIIKV